MVEISEQAQKLMVDVLAHDCEECLAKLQAALDAAFKAGVQFVDPLLGMSAIQVLEKGRAEGVRQERERCARDVCMYCGQRAPGYWPANGPNEAGNWTHTDKVVQGRQQLCMASAIWARTRVIKADEEIEAGE